MYDFDIKFRGKSVKDGKWVYGDFFNDNGKQCFIIFYNSAIEHHVGFGKCYLRTEKYEEIDPATTGLYTGLKDKNGTEIYTGDIVQIHQFLFDGNEFEQETIGVIKWGEYGWILSNINSKTINDWMGYNNGDGEAYLIDFYGLHEDGFEVIGNIYDNPELLEVDQ